MKATAVSVKRILGSCLFAFALVLASHGQDRAGGTAGVPVSSLALLAGNMNGPGSVDGVGTAARFTNPSGIATDAGGNVYVADTDNHTIRKITPAGAVTTLAGTAGIAGSADGTGAAARFKNPSGVATDAAGNVYVADTDNQTIRKITPAGVVTALAGTAKPDGSGASASASEEGDDEQDDNVGSVDGTGVEARFNNPRGISTDSVGNVYVADEGNSTIRKITPAGIVTTLAGTAGTRGSIATDSAGNVYVADDKHAIRKITPAGAVTTLAGTAGTAGSADGTGTAARFNYPRGVATDSASNVYVADTTNRTIRKITLGGAVSTLAGTARTAGSADGTGAAARFLIPAGIATDRASNVYVADSHIIRKITPAAVVTTLAGGATSIRGRADGAGAAARFDLPRGVAADGAGNAYVADQENHTIRKITPAGLVSTFAGTAGVKGSADGTGAAASFDRPEGVATDTASNVYVADSNNQTIRKITPTGVVTTLAGTARIHGSADGTGAAASFHSPVSVATDRTGNVYVADAGNNIIRKITPAGVVTTLAGTAETYGSADGVGAAARFRLPVGVATDGAGNVYVADHENHTIRKIMRGRVVTTLAGTALAPGRADGTRAAARFNAPTGVATDSAGNVYVADTGNHTIRKITPAGVVNTVVGVAGQGDFAPGALPGFLMWPKGVAVSGSSLYITLYNGVALVQNRP